MRARWAVAQKAAADQAREAAATADLDLARPRLLGRHGRQRGAIPPGHVGDIRGCGWSVGEDLAIDAHQPHAGRARGFGLEDGRGGLDHHRAQVHVGG